MLDTPLLDYTIEFLARNGVKEVYVLCCVFADMIKKHIEKNWKQGDDGPGGPLLADGRALERSDAVLAIAARLPFPWPLLGAFRVLPQGLRDLAYRFVARRRYRWVGRRESCMVPTPALRDRFID